MGENLQKAEAKESRWVSVDPAIARTANIVGILTALSVFATQVVIPNFMLFGFLIQFFGMGWWAYRGYKKPHTLIGHSPQNILYVMLGYSVYLSIYFYHKDAPSSIILWWGIVACGWTILAFISGVLTDAWRQVQMEAVIENHNKMFEWQKNHENEFKMYNTHIKAEIDSKENDKSKAAETETIPDLTLGG